LHNDFLKFVSYFRKNIFTLTGLAVCCIVGLALEPLSGAIAAGNAVVVKPSEFAPATAAFLASNLPKYLDPRAVKVVLGGPEVGEQLMEHRWDKVLFTGDYKP
jgi:acyl-CoA reductase-like NAD-dependent aldehyde dehydrogenase